MHVGKRIRQLRGQKGLSQGDIERRVGLVRCHISRIENEHVLPSLDTLRRFAVALEVPLSELLCDEQEGPFLEKLQMVLKRVGKRERHLLLNFAKTLARDATAPVSKRGS